MAQLASLTPQQRQSLFDGPALPPPPGVIPQFDQPPDLKSLSMGFETTGFLLATIALCIRMVRLILQYFYIGAVLYGPAIVSIRSSIILQYLQIFVPNKKPFNIYLTAQILIWVNVVFGIIYTFLMLFGFSPRQKAWDPLVEGASEFDMLGLHVAGGAIVAASDLGALVLPQISVWQLQMTCQKKFQISAIFLVGAL
ncbi:MAG: hypothetical protein Q9207_005846 [Kuettlingeria erythrocarpa]